VTLNPLNLMTHPTFVNAPNARRLITLLCIGGIAALLGYFYWHTCRRIAGGNLDDFPHFYWAADAVLHHRDPYLSGTRGYIYPPLLAYLYVPVAKLSPSGAAYAVLPVLVLCTLGALLLASWEALRRVGAAVNGFTLGTVAMLALLLIEDKVKGDLQMLQTNSLVLLLFALGLYWLDRSPLLCGAALGMAFNIKYLSLVMLPYLLLRRRWATAGWFIAWAVALALLPALWSGWEANLSQLKTAYAGIGRLVGIAPASSAAAETHDLRAGFSLSVPSALARATKSDGTALVLTAGIALAWAATGAWVYRRRGLPVLAWPTAQRQRQQPYCAMVGIEYACLVAAALAFSPQTDSRHLVLILIPDAMAAAMLLHARPALRRGTWLTLCAGMLVLLAGLTLPPGNRHGRVFSASTTWLAAGGPCWCLLVMTLTLIGSGAVWSPGGRRRWNG
jgi:hypothetical protein